MFLMVYMHERTTECLFIYTFVFCTCGREGERERERERGGGGEGEGEEERISSLLSNHFKNLYFQIISLHHNATTHEHQTKQTRIHENKSQLHIVP